MTVVEDFGRTSEMVETAGGEAPGGTPQLSAREVEVLLAWFGSDSKDGAASELFISAATVATHIARVRVKYAGAGRPARSKTALFARLLEDGHTSLRDW
ncbi:LuxR C-terminal-related transcriptional regulator [Tsukamurella pseudospumae]|nr:LuxR C-terminal-related transcriptional regulator [Tsukamurella pseudospumae]